jgi:hypothetical protein
MTSLGGKTLINDSDTRPELGLSKLDFLYIYALIVIMYLKGHSTYSNLKHHASDYATNI